MIADDQEDILYVLKAILSRHGYTVITDQTGTSLEHMDGEKPDLILLDLNLDHKDGAEICRHLKEDLQTKSIPIILMSAKMDIKNISSSCGAEDYLPKPFATRDLVFKVEKFLNAA